MLVVHVLICAVAYALTWRTLFFEVCLLPEPLYARGSVVLGILQHPPTLALLLAGILPLFVYRKRITWAAIDDSMRMRGFVWIVALVVGVSFAASGYNYHYDTSFIFDRLAIVALLVALRFHPAFLFPLVLTVMAFALQIHHPLPEPMWNWPSSNNGATIPCCSAYK